MGRWWAWLPLEMLPGPDWDTLPWLFDIPEHDLVCLTLRSWVGLVAPEPAWLSEGEPF